MKKPVEVSNYDIYELLNNINEDISVLHNRLFYESQQYYYLKGKCEAYERMLIKHKLIEPLHIARFDVEGNKIVKVK